MPVPDGPITIMCPSSSSGEYANRPHFLPSNTPRALGGWAIDNIFSRKWIGQVVGLSVQVNQHQQHNSQNRYCAVQIAVDK